MPRITPARPRARAATRGITHHQSDCCDRCDTNGQYSLALGSLDSCGAHRRTHTATDDRRPPGQPRRRALPPRPAATRAQQRAAGLRYGKRRAVLRQQSAAFEVHPGWRGRIPSEFVVVTEQRDVVTLIDRAIDGEMWSQRQRAEWATVLHTMVHAMDWDSGLVIGVTRERLAAVVGRSTRSVSRIWAWAQDVGLLARVEEGASASWLGTSRNRSASFAFVSTVAALRTMSRPDGLLETVSVDESGNPPASCVREKPLERRAKNSPPRWLTFRIPETPSQRLAAARLLVTRAGLDAKSLDQRRLCGLLKSWWQAGTCVAGLLWAIDHHPDTPQVPRGDALRGARDPIAVLGHRLSPWVSRTSELPTSVHGRRGDYLAAQARRLAAATGAPTRPPAGIAASGQVRAAAQAALRDHLANQRRKRTSRAHTTRHSE